MKRISFAQLADELDAMAVRVAASPFEAAELIAPILAESVRVVFGNDPPLPTLADSTQAERERLGFAANQPLVRTGALRDSVESAAIGSIAATGSNDPVARYSEDGSFDRPPRPAFLIGGTAALPAAEAIFKDVVGKAIGKVT